MWDEAIWHSSNMSESSSESTLWIDTVTAAVLTGIFVGFRSLNEMPTLGAGHNYYFIILFEILCQAVVRMSFSHLYISFHNPFLSL